MHAPPYSPANVPDSGYSVVQHSSSEEEAGSRGRDIGVRLLCVGEVMPT